MKENKLQLLKVSAYHFSSVKLYNRFDLNNESMFR